MATVVYKNKQCDVTVTQFKTKRFSVRYGLQVKSGLDYVTAAHELGECLFHALACESILDNSGA